MNHVTRLTVLGLGVLCFLELLAMRREALFIQTAEAKVVKIGIITPPVPTQSLSDFLNHRPGALKPAHFIGSGAFINKDGLVLTCAHLFTQGAAKIFVNTDNQVYTAILIKEDKANDLALIKIFPWTSVSYFHVGKNVSKGQTVYAFGSPLNFQGCVTRGWVSNLSVGEDKFTMHTAPINPGNSGGPLVDDQGNLVGVNVSGWMVNPFQAAQGMENAVNLDKIKDFIHD